MSDAPPRPPPRQDARREETRERTIALPDGPIVVVETGDVNAALDEAIRAGKPSPYGHVLWESAVCIAHRLASWPLAGVRVLELGAGCGLVSLACARRGADALATDLDDDALALLSEAARRQGLAVRTRRFDVTTVEPLPPTDIVVLADVLYEETLAAAAGRRAREALAMGATVLVGDPGRVFRRAFVANVEREVLFEPMAVDGAASEVAVLRPSS
jgi:predicted nicotinamide N-methyase